MEDVEQFVAVGGSILVVLLCINLLDDDDKAEE